MIFLDFVEFYFGGEGDLCIFYNGDNFFIIDLGIGNLNILFNGVGVFIKILLDG